VRRGLRAPHRLRRQVAPGRGGAPPGQGGSLSELVVIGLGSNLGDRLAHLREAARELREWSAAAHFSSIWETAPRGPVADQPAFLNACAALPAPGEPREVLERLLALERRLGRVRDVPQGPRTIDLDILLYGARTIDEPGLHVPHPRMRERAFVLAPLAELMGERFRLGETTLEELLRAVADQPVHRRGSL